jgi:ribosomal protein S12 methylthiotransferase accessory factor YcaO
MAKPHVELLARVSKALAEEYDIRRLEYPDLPIFLAIAIPRAEGVTGDRPRLPAGRGLTLNQAMLAAGAEALELRASLARNHGAARSPRRNMPAMAEAADLLSGETVLFPAQRVYLDHPDAGGEGPPVGADSTGCAAGVDYAQACRSGLLECIERDAVALWWHGGLRRAALSLALIDPAAPRLGWWLEERPRRTVLLDVTQDNGVPAVVAYSCDPDGGRIAVGSAAGFTITEAALAAVTEMIQTETGLELAASSGDDEALRWLSVASVERMPQFQPDRGAPPVAQQVLDTGEVLHSLACGGYRVTASTLTLPGDPLVSVRVSVSGYCALRGQIDAPRFRRITGRSYDASQLLEGGPLEPY